MKTYNKKKAVRGFKCDKDLFSSFLSLCNMKNINPEETIEGLLEEYVKDDLRKIVYNEVKKEIGI